MEKVLFHGTGTSSKFSFIVFLIGSLVSSCFFLSIPISSALASPVVLNEFVVDGDIEWVELYIASESADFLRTFWLDDDTDFMEDAGSGKKKSLDGIVASGIYPYFELNSFFNNSGDAVVLFDNSGTIIDQYSYTNSPGKNNAIGRNPDGTGAFALLEAATKGGANSAISQPSPTVTPSPTKIPALTKPPAPTKTPKPVEKNANKSVEAISATKPMSQERISPVVQNPTTEEKDEDILGLSSSDSSKTTRYYAIETKETGSVASDSVNKDRVNDQSEDLMKPWYFLLFGGLSFTGMVASALRVVIKNKRA
ncbi:lamin tail domain-containing protein [Candidatus Roizmanbacteria bacterium]|nr:lamin tail domain-containing protein [Candidatus Roizmanbacteria bacterium]